jgi:hypothetical protein
MFSHLLKPPTAVSPRAGAAEGVALGVAAVLGVSEGAALGVAAAPGVLDAPVLGVADGAVLGAADGAVLGVLDGAVLGAVEGAAAGVSEGAVLGGLVDCASAEVVITSAAVALSSLRIMCISLGSWSCCVAESGAAATQPLQRSLERRDQRLV